MSEPLQSSLVAPATRKTGGLWSYILPPTSAASSPMSNPSATAPTTAVPATGPSDRSVVSVRLMLGDAKAALQQLSERVERVVEEAGNSRREVVDATRGIEEAQNGILKQVQVTVKQVIASVQEASKTHTSSLEAADARIMNLERIVAAESKTISELSQMCLFNQSRVSEVIDRIAQTHSAVLSLSPVIPMLQAIPTDISNAQLKSTNMIEQLQVEILRTARDTRLECLKVNKDQEQGNLDSMETLLGAKDEAWRDQMDAVVGHVKREAEKCREDWTRALSMHRQEVCGLLSVHLAARANGAIHGTTSAMQPDPTGILDTGSWPNASSLARPIEPEGNDRAPVQHAPSPTSHQVERLSEVDATGMVAQPMRCEILPETCGSGGSIADTAGLTIGGRIVRVDGLDKHCAQIHAKDNEPDVPNRPDRRHQEVSIQPALELESQSTTLSSLPELDQDRHEVEDSQDVIVEIQEDANSPPVRSFGALSEAGRAQSAHVEFVTPNSPPFSAARKPIIVGDPARRRNVQHFLHSPTISGLRSTSGRLPTATASPGSAEAARSSTLGRSSPQSTSPQTMPPPFPLSPKQKRTPVSQTNRPAKRMRTRILMTEEECRGY